MKVTAKIENVSKVDVTVSITMGISDWQIFDDKVRATEMATSFPFWRILEAISAATQKAKASYQETVGDE